MNYMNNDNVLHHLIELAKEYKLPMNVLVGVTMAESSFKADQTRYEPAYRYLMDVKKDTPFRKLSDSEAHSKTPPKDFPGVEGVTTAEEEWVGQRTSTGPMQIMGAVARELGYKGSFKDFDDYKSLPYGVKHFSNLYKRFFDKHGIEGVISSYNCGQPKPEANPDYVKKVVHWAAHYDTWEGK